MTSNLAMIERRPRTVRSGHQVCAPVLACEVSENEIDCRSRLGVAPAPDGEPDLAESSGAWHVVEMHARRMMEVSIRFIGHPDFEDSTATAVILGAGPARSVEATARMRTGPERSFLIPTPISRTACFSRASRRSTFSAR